MYWVSMNDQRDSIAMNTCAVNIDYVGLALTEKSSPDTGRY